MEDFDFTIRKTIEGLGFELWGLESSRTRSEFQFRIFIDQPKGIKIEDCELVWRQINDVLRVDGSLREDFSLEVSSPGINRKFYYSQQYKRFVGSLVQIRLKNIIDGSRNIKAIIKDATNDTLYLASEGDDIKISFDNIDKAQLVGELSI
ncbi:ribosome maturation factor RimP [Pseudomonadota bacterium]|nr:ribosome maturation factor RimP [Pseudomonadota bacterium]